MAKKKVRERLKTDMLRNELLSEVQKKISAANMNIAEYNSSPNQLVTSNNLIKRIESLGGTSRAGSGIGMSFKRMTKKQLVALGNELDYFNKYMDDEASRTKREQKAFKEFNKKRKGRGQSAYRYQHWRSMVEFSASLSSMLDQYGFRSEEYVDIHERVHSKNRKEKTKTSGSDVIKVIEQELRQVKRDTTTAYTHNKVLDDIVKKLGIEDY